MISTAITEAMTDDSSVGDNLEYVIESGLEIEILMKGPDPVIEDFMVSTSHTKDESKISTEDLRKFWHANHKNV